MGVKTAYSGIQPSIETFQASPDKEIVPLATISNMLSVVQIEDKRNKGCILRKAFKYTPNRDIYLNGANVCPNGTRMMNLVHFFYPPSHDCHGINGLRCLSSHLHGSSSVVVQNSGLVRPRKSRMSQITSLFPSRSASIIIVLRTARDWWGTAEGDQCR